MRDNFPKQTITELAKGVGYRCSNPDCARPTVAANAAQDKTVSIGVAAHICAASPGGPRYSAIQSAELRSGKDNGIWLCQACARLVDVDPNKFTAQLLVQWKRDAQSRAFRDLVAPHKQSPNRSEEAVRVHQIIAADNATATDTGYDEVFAKVHTFHIGA